ncbi:Der GTPase-activating protein YihI [Catenovulum sediminis]|uniref:Der GTPase-activating protein YihI n=1 Tax=Catenovulum sediminis TaxID=1740262 RepID=A0ABV1RED6_9ALTE|nr:Der GTPase-activating protein YihI [Catenovulum sediminis]
MTRIKKSRKIGPLAKSKSETSRSIKPQASAKHKRKGQKPGSRHSVSEYNTAEQSTTQKDPRLGSKKPIDLSATDKPKTEIKDVSPQIKITKNKPQEDQSDNWWTELEEIEQNDELQALLNRLDQGEDLTAHELAFFNKKMARHAWLAEKLGIEEIDEDEALLDAFENSDLKRDL